MQSDRPLTIIAPRGLGDACVCLPAAYRYAEERPVALLNAGAVNFAATLPTLVPLAAERWEDGDVLDISQGLSFHSPMRMFAQVSLRLGVYPLAIPTGPWLRRPPEYADQVRSLGVPEPYVLICPEGSQHNRRIGPDQIAAIAERWPVVIAHDKPMPDLPCTLNLSGQCSLQDLYALTCCARAVVAPDTGTLHLAGAFGTPVLAIIGNTLTPYSFCLDYTPSLWLLGQDSWTIKPADCVAGLQRLLEETE